jgi:hypothetical protein
VAPVNPPAWQEAGDYSAKLDRQVLAAMLTPHSGGGPLVARGGVKPLLGGTSLSVIQRPTPDMWVRVNPGACYIPATSALGGTYICANDAAYDIQLDPAHATLPRLDLVYARVADAVDDTGAANEFQIDNVTGTPASSPVRPAAPSQSIPLAEVLVAAADTSIVTADITDLRTYVTALGGTLPVKGTSDLPANPYIGMKVYRLDLLAEQVWDGVAWRTLLDTGFSAAIGTIGYGEWDCSPAYSTTSTGGSSVRYDGTNVARVNFTIPAGLPSTRVIRFTQSMNVQVPTSNRASALIWLDGTTAVRDRRINATSDGFARGMTRIDTVRPTSPIVAAGAHFIECRVKVDSSASAIIVNSLELHVEII